MTSQAFEAALKEPDSNASYARLHELLTTQNLTSLKTPTVAGTYLRAFCDTTSSHIRRRWIGIALARMIERSSDAIEYLKQLRQELLGLGSIILSNTEREETKIVAGIIVRQALQQGIQYSHFWGTDKVKNSAPNFPGDSGPRWISEFQNFLDTLGDLALANPITDPSIIYAVSITASDGFRWRDSTEELLVAIVQAGLLTVVALGSSLEDFLFLDIPVAHIGSMHCQRSSLYDSQARNTTHEPWDLILKLEAEAWTYRLNTSSHTGDEVMLLFEQSQDARELKNCIAEHQSETKVSATASSKAHPKMSASSPIHIRSVLLTHANKTSKPHAQQTVSQPHSFDKKKSLRPPVSSDDILNASPTRSSKRAPHLEENIRHKKNEKEKVEQEVPLQKKHRDDGTKLSRSATSENTPEGIHSTENIKTTCSRSKNTDRDQGKLKKVSQETKNKATKQLCAHSDIVDLQEEDVDVENNDGTNSSLSFAKSSWKRPQNSKGVGQETGGGKRRPKTRSKRKADDDDDEFVPVDKKSKRVKTNTRKTRFGAVSNPQTLDVKTHPQSLPVVPSHKEGTKFKEKKELSTQQRHKAECTKKHSSSPPASRHPVIDGLLDSQKPVRISEVPIEKTKVPDGASPASIPIQSSPRFVETTPQPQTPTDTRKRPSNGGQSQIFSSPPLGTKIRESWFTKTRNRTEIEILSSNSKPVPASPNAESTAISGHADREDVDQEKKEGESQTAKSDPFTQKSSSQKATSFTRRLTAETAMDEKEVYASDQSSDQSECLVNDFPLDFPDVDEILSGATSDPFPQRARNWTENSPTVTSGFNSQSLCHTRGPYKQAIQLNVKPKDVIDSHLLRKAIDKQASPSKAKTSETEIHMCVDDKKRPTFNAEERPVPSSAVFKSARTLQDIRDVKVNNNIHTITRKMVENTRINEPDQNYSPGDWDGDATLVDDTEDNKPFFEINPSSIRLRSSRPVSDLPSDQNSTSTSSRSPSPSPLPTSEAEEMEWEANLQPHQRSLHDLLIRVSKRVMRHIVDNEHAVMDIANMYAEDGEHLLNVFLGQYGGNLDHIFEDMENKTHRLKNELESAVRKVAKERRRVSAVV